MDYRKTEQYKVKEFRPGQLRKAFTAAARIIEPDTSDLTFSITHQNKSVGSYTKTIGENELKAVCGFGNDIEGIRVNLKGLGASISLSVLASILTLQVASKDPAQLSEAIELLRRELELQPFTAEDMRAQFGFGNLDKLVARIEHLENQLTSTPKRLKCFFVISF